MKALLRIALTIALVNSVPAFAQTPNTQAPDTDVASPALQKEFEAFIAKFRAALKANDASAIAEMTKFPFGADPSVDAAQFRAKTYRSIFNAKIRTCIQRGKGVYSRDDYKNESYFIFCDDDIFVFTKTPAGFLFTEVGVND
ncbi:MAG: hypothetical protein KIT15_03535 [Xanthobacteraceae bacterium]|nr:hypothetical protein [Xanthobacteraceae bacterium]MBX3549290.1 hypothetical protein [Xanthobacteraceae bacterium]MCW5673630.1 hypothetical protein [Xanthobacteraceae bacterium]